MASMFFLSLCLLMIACGGVNSYRMVAAPRNTCTTKRAYAIIGMIRSQCNTMGGAWNGSPGPNDWISCHLDWCDVPSSGSVAQGAVWGIDVLQTSTATSSTRTYGIIEMIRRDCDNLRGRYNGNPTISQWIGCHLYFVQKDGSSRDNIMTLVMAGVGDCQNKVAYGILEMIGRECGIVGGAVNGDPGANDWIKCHLDICVSPVIDCVPSDLWSPIQVCRNPSSSTLKCDFTLTTGIEKQESTSSTNGGNVEVSVTAEVGAELEGIFSASVSTTMTTGFNWETTSTSTEIWSSSTTRSLSVTLSPGQSVSINQVVGMCGDFRVQTYEYRVEDI